MKTFRTHASQSAFTLLELMIAMLIGVFLMVGVIQIFSSAKQAYRLQENLSRLQENGRFAIDFITKDLRMAGFLGCSAKNTLKAPDPFNIPNSNPAIAIHGVTSASIDGLDGADKVANNWAPTNTWCGAANQCITNTDVISFQFAKSCGGQLTATAPQAANSDITISTSNSCGIKANDTLLIADCTSSDVFLAGTVAGNKIKHTAALSKEYKADAELLVFQSVSYFIRSGTGGVPSLYRVDYTKAIDASNPVELVEGIENMQIFYGIDTDATQDYVANYYVPSTGIPANISAGGPTGLSRVVSVRISLLAVTPDNGLTFSTKADGTEAPQSYIYIDPADNISKTITPPDVCSNNGVITSQTLPCTSPAKQVKDQRIRRVFSSTIAVRNRLL